MLSYIRGEEKWKNLSKNLKKLIFMPSHIIGEIKLKNLTKFIKNFKILIFLYTNRRSKTEKSQQNYKNFLRFNPSTYIGEKKVKNLTKIVKKIKKF